MPHLPRTDTRRHGFTLLEMTVVIAIIGIVSGMVVAGRAYLYHAQLNQMAQDAQYYRAAFNQFEDKYVAAPGDMANASTIWQYAKNGDGNGVIDAGNGAEIMYVFQHLSNAGMIDGFFNGTPGAAGPYHAIPGLNIPVGPLPRSGFYFRDIAWDTVPAGDPYWFAGFYARPLLIGNDTGNFLPQSPMLTPKETLMIDTKYDDGMPGMGNIRAPHNGFLVNCTNGTNPGAAQYLLGYKATACFLIFTQP